LYLPKILITSYKCVIFSVFFPDKDEFNKKLDQKKSIKGLKSNHVQILGADRFENFVWIETKHGYSIICQTQDVERSNKKQIEGFVCKKYKEGRMELGRFKSKDKWKDGELDNWNGVVLDICSKDETSFRHGNKTLLKFYPKSQTWKEFDCTIVGTIKDDISTPTKVDNQVKEEEEETHVESSGQQKYETQTLVDDMLNSRNQHSVDLGHKQIDLQNDKEQVPKGKIDNANMQDHSAEPGQQRKSQTQFPERDYKNNQSNQIAE
jgi:hypothetical protein